MTLRHAINFGFLSVLTLFMPVFNSLADSITVALPSDGYAPFIIINNDEVKGILVEPLQLATASLGIEINYVYYPENRSRVMLESNLIDARMESEQWADQPQHYLWTEAITILEDVLVFNKTSPSDFSSDADLAGAVIVSHLGYSYPTLQPLIEQKILHRIDFSSEYDMLSHLVRPIEGINSAAVMNKYVAISIINATPKFQGHFLISKRQIASAPLQFQFFKSERLLAIVTQINTELRRLKRDQTIEKITSRILKGQDIKSE